MKFLIFILSCILSLSTSAMSAKYRGGDGEILMKNNNICFYVEKDNLKGEYELNIFHKESFEKVFQYASSFEKSYPNQKKCIEVKKNIFNHKSIYTAVIDTGYTNFGKDFCILGSNDSRIGEYNGRSCVPEDKSIIEKITIFIKNIF